MSQTPTSNVKGLHKHHSRKCANRRGRPTNCDCPWYGFYKRTQKGLAEWSGQQVDPRKLRPAEIVQNRFKGAIDNRTYNPDGEQQSLGSGQRFRDFVQEWRTHYAEAHHLTSNSLPTMLDVLVEGFGEQTLEQLAGAPLKIERWLNAAQKERGWTGNTWNRYYELLNTVFNRAIKWKTSGVSRMAANPMASIEKRTGTKRKFETRPEEPAEQALIAACDQLNRP